MLLGGANLTLHSDTIIETVHTAVQVQVIDHCKEFLKFELQSPG